MTLFGAASLEGQGDAAVPVATLARAHLVGIGGAGMRSLADVLDEAGWQVSGSDLVPSSLDGAPFQVRQGHDAAEIDQSIDLVVYSNAVPPANPELRRARQLGIPTLSYPEMLGRLMQSRGGVAIAGTHGKSTTTAMAAEILTAAGLDPTVVVGAAPIGGNSGGRFGHGRLLLVEACEYRAGFHHLKPEMAAILNIEPDHFDCFLSRAELEHAFARFVQAVPPGGLVLARADCAATLRACAELACTCETFGMTPAATWQAADVGERRGYYSFQIRCQASAVCEVKLPVPGRHNVLNALAAAAVASHCGATGAAIREGLERFVGLRRRLQLLGEVRDVALVDDYAHHPTEVAATLATLRQMYAGRRLWCVFEPHQVSRLARLLDEFARSLQNADKVVVADVFRARELVPDREAVTAEHLCRRVADLGGDAVQLASAAEIQDHLRQSLRPGDVLVTMGAGDIGRVAHELGKGLRTFRKAD
ncbi:MAG: UDP-N-acetylmuramate--L-alanine ligase [Pirellulales bacterium]